jgi:hypothetical protein
MPVESQFTRLPHRLPLGLGLAMAAALLGTGCGGLPIGYQLVLEVPKHLLMKAYNERELSKACSDMHTVERALSERCGEYVPGRLAEADVNRAAPEECPLTVATVEPRRWKMLPELMSKGARADRCTIAPFTALLKQRSDAQLDAALRSASLSEVAALRSIASNDPQAIQPNVVRWLSSPAAREAGLHGVLHTWVERGQLDPRRTGFEPLAWLHPSALTTPLAGLFLDRGQRADVAMRSNPGAMEDALRTGDFAAMDWWFSRVPGLTDLVVDNRQLRINWRPLAYVATPGVIADSRLRQDVARHLLTRGADPNATLPQDPAVTVMAQAQRTSPDLVPLMKASLAARQAALVAARRAELSNTAGAATPATAIPQAAAAVGVPVR